MVSKSFYSDLDVPIYQYIGTLISYFNFPYDFSPLTHLTTICKGQIPIFLLESESAILIERLIEIQ